MKNIRSIVMRVFVIAAYWCGINALFYFLNRNAKRILCFHNVLPDEIFRSDLAGTGVIRLSEFEEIVRYCKRKFPITTDMHDARSLTLTFDDGYRNQYTVVYKCMKRFGVPGCLFVSGQKDRPLVIDIINHWRFLAPPSIVGDCSKFWNDQIWPLYQCDWQNRGQAAVEFCNDLYPIKLMFGKMSDEYRNQRFGYITDSEREEMRKDGWLIGWHTKNHYPLAYLPKRELQGELMPLDSRMRAVCFSFPYGVESLVGVDAVDLVRETGYPCAVSNTMFSTWNCCQHFLPRMQLEEDKYRMDYELSGLAHFMRTHKLLPVLRCENEL